MTSSIYGITVTVLVMYIFLGTSVTFCKLRKNFAHVFGKRNEGFIPDNAEDIYEKQVSDPLIEKIRIYQELGRNRNSEAELLTDSYYNQDGDADVTPQVVNTYGTEPRRNSLSLLDLMSPVEKEYLSYLYDLEAENEQPDRFPKYI